MRRALACENVALFLVRLGVLLRAPFHGAVIEVKADEAERDGDHEHDHGEQVLSHAETFMDRYLDGNGYYTGVNEERGSDLSAGATLSYNAIRDAMESVARLGLGGQS